MADLGKAADRLERITSFHVMALLEQAQKLEQQGRDIIHLEVGEPDFPTPDPVVQAGIQAMQAGHTRYTPARGLPALRQAISDFYLAKFGVSVAMDRIIITPGASGAIGLLSGLLFNSGDGVLLTDPGYPCNDNFLHLVGAEPQRVASGPLTNYQLNADLVRHHWQPNTRAVWLASPSNPTGTLVAQDDIVAIKQQVDAHQGALLVDEIYHCLVYDQPAETVLSLQDDHASLFVINSFSKYFNMTGWRLGWLVAPESHISDLDKLMQNYYLAAPTIAQHAALAAFSDEALAVYEQRRVEMGQRRDFLLQRLPGLGIQVPCKPEGAFYIYCDVSAITDDSFEFCQQLLQESGVAVTPGIDFGTHQAQSHIRIAYSASLERLEEAIHRIAAFIG